MRAIETNVLVRLITRDDPGQVAAAEEFVERGAWVPMLALAEATWVLASVYGLSSEDVARAIGMLLEHRQLVLQEPEAVAGALELFRARRGVDFSDCLMLELARKAGHLPLGTFDRNLSKINGAQKVGQSSR
ncbi:MAG: type II toxin-antitoxin system VapC family toxin [Acidobacteria bacterium]|nr:type II toxin-antitoxin system VapC family toxin [Acidobacteriota bacterium]MBI3278465.1 type II toxin-antitoxin system VapC family toxin [Acidobacteriota bacterium]